MASPPSSPPAIDFPTSDADVEMEETPVDSVPHAPPRQQTPLFHAASPSVSGTPRHLPGSSIYGSSPIRGLTARRAVGMDTPRRHQEPLFARAYRLPSLGTINLMVNQPLQVLHCRSRAPPPPKHRGRFRTCTPIDQWTQTPWTFLRMRITPTFALQY
jgi:hypothetical protein